MLAMDRKLYATDPARALADTQWQVAERDEFDHIKTPYVYVKRALDFTVALAILVLLSPVMLLIAVAIRLDSEGPALFRQRRVCFDASAGAYATFTLYKFRTMAHNADESLHQEYVSALICDNAGPASGKESLKMNGDPRVTRVGRFLRRSSLDELPQLFNILRGEMSLVGPRPALPYEVALYEPWHMRRLQAPPGLTGWWQVNGRNQVCFDDMVRMDVFYIENCCLAMDLRILLATPKAVISGKGAG
jgi:lipopolysaccharide/colanic/teichoic acid biosynthesis glycosyltransferase